MSEYRPKVLICASRTGYKTINLGSRNKMASRRIRKLLDNYYKK